MKPLNQAAIAVAVATLATVAGAQESDKVMEYLNLLDRDATVREARAASSVWFGQHSTDCVVVGGQSLHRRVGTNCQ